MTRILLIEDHQAIAVTLWQNLVHEGYEVSVAADGVAGAEQAGRWNPHLIILDLMLPRLDGFGVLRNLRSGGLLVPVLVLTARGSEAEKVQALKAGADDYVVKPFGLLEILARVEALLRRGGGTLSALVPEEYRLGDLIICVPERRVTRGRLAIDLRPKEFDLLVALVRAGGHVLARQELLTGVWGYDPTALTRTVDTHIAALRHRLGDDPERPRYVETVRKAGYRTAST